MLVNKALITAKVETTYGTDAVPTGATNSILCEEPTVEALESKVERANIKPNYGAQRFVSIGEGLKISFTVELKGSGTAGTAPEIGALLRGCNFTETIQAAVSVTYLPNSSQAGESLSLYYYADGMLHKILGARGTFSVAQGTVNQYVKLKFEFTGLYAGPAALALATPTFNAAVPPVWRNAQFTLDAYAAVLNSLTFDIGNSIAKRTSLNSATGILEWYVSERSVKGEFDPEMVLPATYDFWGKWQSGGAYPLTATIGSAAGNRCVITAPAVQLDMPKYDKRETTLTAKIPLVFAPTSAGNDEIQLLFN